ncbi:MAG: SDR family NAD(P)-dependent oxidoreductase [Myxococcota bacterium]
MSIPKPLRVMVTGATGFLGSHAVRAILEAGHRVVAFVRSPDKASRVFGDHTKALEIARGDIGDEASVRGALTGCDSVIHCAATVALDAGNTPEKLIATNVRGARNVIGTALDLGIERIVHVSSVATLFRRGGGRITEASELVSSKLAYSQSKIEADLYVRDLQAVGRPVQILYPGAIIGPDDPGLTDSMRSIQIFARVFLPVTSTGIQYVDARDLGLALCRMVEDEPNARRFIAAGNFVTWSELATVLERVTGDKPPTYRVPAWAFRVAGRVADSLRHVTPIELPLSLESASYVTQWTRIDNSEDFGRLGVRFRDLEESMADTVRWMREAGHL